MDSLEKEIAHHQETARQLARHRDQLEVLSRQQSLKLEETQARVKVLSGFLPTCACCKKIRNATGEWEPMESYIRNHSEAEFSHSYCPECARRLHSDYLKA